MKKIIAQPTARYISAAVGATFLFFLCITVFNTFFEYKEETGLIIAQDIALLEKIFKTIHETVGIAGFDLEKNPINFLTIKKNGFVGSQVGSMNLIHHNRWQGPYVERNPSIQNKEYQIVVTQKGDFITPADGVVLPNNKVIGRDIIIDKNADIEKMIGDDFGLSYEGKPLAAKIF